MKIDESKIPLLFDEEAEESLLGGVIIQEGIPPGVLKYGLVPRDFYIIRNQWVWRVILSLASFDIRTVWEELEKKQSKQELSGFGGPARLTTLVYRCQNSCDIERDAQLIKELSERRFALRIANRLAQVVYALNEPFDLNDIILKLYNSRVKIE